jgi:hypothetical protein
VRDRRVTYSEKESLYPRLVAAQFVEEYSFPIVDRTGTWGILIFEKS